MSKLDDLPVGDERGREPKEGERLMASITPGCSIVVIDPDLVLGDFYRTSTVLAKDVPPYDPDKKGVK